MAGLLFSNVWGHAGKSVLGYATNLSASALLSETNAQREQNQLGDVKLNNQLTSAAQAKASDMAARDYWAHNTPGGQTPWTFITTAGYNYQTAGENLAYGFDSSDDTTTAWMNSPEHRANILNNTYVDVGFGIANSPNYQGSGPETIVVAMYASPQPEAAAAAQPSVPVSAAPASQPTLTPVSSNADSNKQVETNATATSIGSTPAPATTKNIARIQLLAKSSAPWSALAITVLASVCLVILVMRHGVFWRRALVKSEAFVINHKLLDIVLVVLVVAGFVLTRTAGVIH
ncbi:MAG TPA: CAP domain-containing protein [Candidatus Saccharimonadales bacterium]|nr:CAP domain-containing protein [Candidatus Saccharimonadales bacterium]